MALSILLFVVFIVLLFYVFNHILKFLGKELGTAAHRHHKDMELMSEESHVPSVWINHELEVLRSKKYLNQGDRHRTEKKIRKTVLRNLGKMRKYFDKAPVFESAEARLIVFRIIDKEILKWSTEEVETLISKLSEKDIQ